MNPTTSNPIDLARLDSTLRLLRACKIVVGKDSQFVTEPIKGNDFSVNREGVWVGDRKRVEMGELRCTALPNVSNAGIRMQVRRIVFADIYPLSVIASSLTDPIGHRLFVVRSRTGHLSALRFPLRKSISYVRLAPSQDHIQRPTGRSRIWSWGVRGLAGL